MRMRAEGGGDAGRDWSGGITCTRTQLHPVAQACMRRHSQLCLHLGLVRPSAALSSSGSSIACCCASAAAWASLRSPRPAMHGT